ncbi:hypothetical protein CC78DRAFT_273413 [Lojkania enalia]|uniref:Low temperature requirement A n=1 Tax=Lojkania enalia TaxID=147567 RepID=A0A9P4N2F7_9PLEO|nr:hypothetical protein CC78DRAFT_273413 [Didymosphaeria enalia]
MGFSIHGHWKRDVDAEKHLKRLHKTTPWIESPLEGADHEHLVFSQRHEANTLELFFDLFFVANLATFTTYHSITDTQYLYAYIGFFGILWSCWFQVTLHDVRFARDSIYERLCKTIQLIVFVGLALVGSGFNPGAVKADPKIFRVLCYTLVISRALLTVQHIIILLYVMAARYSKLYLPLSLMIGIYTLATICFGAMVPAFRSEKLTHTGVYVVWYIVSILEGVGIIVISCFWRMLSFKKTHLMERMSLLTLIVIGEGAIGVTKTVSRLMSKDGLDTEGCALVMCVILVLVLIWALYFDNFPHGHYGTIRQQIWSILHFPFQLAIVGVVEGSQQVALARYVLKNYEKIEKSIIEYCFDENLDGATLRDALSGLVEYWQFEKKIETYGYTEFLNEFVWAIGNTTDVCSPENTALYEDAGEWPMEFYNLTIGMFNAVYQGLGMKLPIDKLEKKDAAEIAIHSWKVVYIYYWISFCMLVACSVGFLFLIRRHRVDLFDFVSVISRLIALVIGFILIALVASDDALYGFLGSPGVLPACLSLLFLILFFDKLSAVFCNWRLKKSGKPYALEESPDHHHHHKKHAHESSEHGLNHQYSSHHSHHDSLALDHRKSAAWSVYSDREPLTGGDTSYYGGQESYVMSPMMSPPVPTPAQTTPEYMSVSTSQHYGA